MTKEVVEVDKVNEKQLREEESWKFLPRITDQVAALKEEVQKQILQYGEVLRDQEVVYIHVVDNIRAVNSGVKGQQQQVGKGGQAA